MFDPELFEVAFKIEPNELGSIVGVQDLRCPEPQIHELEAVLLIDCPYILCLDPLIYVVNSHKDIAQVTSSLGKWPHNIYAPNTKKEPGTTLKQVGLGVP